MKKLLWRTVDGNQLWLRGVMSRNQNPTSFTQSMEPERNVPYDEMKPVLDQSVEQGMRVSLVGHALIAFDSEEDLILFLLRWS